MGGRPCKFNPENKKSTRGMNGYDKKRYRERFYVQHYILVMGNTGIRVGDDECLLERFGQGCCR